VGLRKKEEETWKKEEKKLGRRARAALSLDPPQGKKLEKAQERVKELQEELSRAPTADIASQATEQSVLVYKVVDCSNKMKGDLVARLRQAAMTNLVAVNVMATRVRKADSSPRSERNWSSYKKKTEGCEWRWNS